MLPDRMQKKAARESVCKALLYRHPSLGSESLVR